MVDLEGLEEVEWATFDAFPDYAINSMGDVFNLRTKRYLTPSPNDNGYLRVGLMVNKKQRFVYIHRMVAMAFLPDYEDGYEIHFKDRNKRNCQVSNLYMATKRARRTEDGLW